MPIDAGDPLPDPSLDAAIDDALAGLPTRIVPQPARRRTSTGTRIGIRLGLEHPDEARQLLEMIDAAASTPAVEPPVDSTAVPIRSALLARDAAVPFAERASIGPDARFGWATMLTRGEIQLLGRVVHEMLGTGAPPDIGRGFGLAWDAGVRLPRKELDQLFREFTELEMTVASVLAGRDLRLEPSLGSDRGGLLGQLIPRGRPATRRRPRRSRAAASQEARPGRHLERVDGDALPGLIPSPTFELLVSRG
jgi:hypothetical protein